MHREEMISLPEDSFDLQSTPIDDGFFHVQSKSSLWISSEYKRLPSRRACYTSTGFQTCATHLCLLTSAYLEFMGHVASCLILWWIFGAWCGFFCCCAVRGAWRGWAELPTAGADVTLTCSRSAISACWWNPALHANPEPAARWFHQLDVARGSSVTVFSTLLVVLFCCLGVLIWSREHRPADFQASGPQHVQPAALPCAHSVSTLLPAPGWATTPPPPPPPPPPHYQEGTPPHCLLLGLKSVWTVSKQDLM